METRDAMLGRVDFEAIQIASVAPGADPSVIGERVAEIARARGEDPFETYFDLVIESRTNAFAIFHSMSEEDVTTAMRFPWVSVASDAEATAPDLHLVAAKRSVERGGAMPPATPPAIGSAAPLVHPRAYGTFPRVLGRYVRDARVLTLEEAVRKMTSLPAAQLGLVDRGVLREGAFADVVVFDPDTVRDTATYERPHAFPVGIDAVVVNGEVTVEGGEHTGARAGRAIRRARVTASGTA
jgi:N-acyl-D-aspartate/D-glutamate deacylase